MQCSRDAVVRNSTRMTYDTLHWAISLGALPPSRVPLRFGVPKTGDCRLGFAVLPLSTTPAPYCFGIREPWGLLVPNPANPRTNPVAVSSGEGPAWRPPRGYRKALHARLISRWPCGWLLDGVVALPPTGGLVPPQGLPPPLTPNKLGPTNLDQTNGTNKL